ncbi:LIC13197/LIC10919/LIC10469 family protein [Aquimarina pacifica]|uniref:LIC13197/LIC10919/LIC10469 family protein n=1 Tax=Aquimarina pacifica TaxID=1296415 RepID=UPI0004AD4AE8|nr:hypothetical protein [Aquimarina pacifica]
MDKFAKRLLKRETGIRDWLKSNKLEWLLEKVDEVIYNLPAEDIKNKFQKEIKRGLQHCVKKNEIRALDFQWYYGRGEIGGALAYGFDSCLTKGSLSKTDLGPRDLSGIELKLEHGNIIDQYFAEIPVSIAINEMIKKINPIVEQSKEIGNLLGDVEDVITDYFQIWNYKIGAEACEQLRGTHLELALKSKAPFWVTMTRHERWSIPIMLIS